MKILLLGAFSFDKLDVGGQPVKTRELYNSLVDKLGRKSVKCIETVGWKKNKIKIVFSVIKSFFASDCVIMLPAQNGVLKLSNLLTILRRFRKKTKLFYDVIGGWLPDLLKCNFKVKKNLSKFNGIWVETDSMKKSLNDLELNNVTVVPNFRNERVCLRIDFQDTTPHKLCIFSRIMKEKGIDLAIKAVASTNLEYGTIFTLDIYGPIDESYYQDFYKAINSNPFINYCGVKKPEESKILLSKYFALLFPTYYPGEGMAGTIIDAFFAGCPVIASDWKYNKEIVNDKVGLIFSPINAESLKSSLLKTIQNPDGWLAKRNNCLMEAAKYTRDNNINKIMIELEQ